ncbi:MAG: hypothetical protein AMXMBFR84_32920 [Candidatus Hydrogenedentota bacterium]
MSNSQKLRLYVAAKDLERKLEKGNAPANEIMFVLSTLKLEMESYCRAIKQSNEPEMDRVAA